MARVGFCGACPTETETSRREAGFPRVFCAYKPIYMDCTLLQNGGRSTVWYAYLKEERAVILRDPLLFNLYCRGRSDSALAGRVPAEAQFTTNKCVDGRSRLFFLAVLKGGTYAPQNDLSESTITRRFDFWATGSRFGEIAPFEAFFHPVSAE